MRRIVSVFLFVGLMQILHAAGMPTGTWIRRTIKDGRQVTMTIESAGTNQTITYRIALPDGRIRTLVVTTNGDGKDVPVTDDSRPSGQTMAFTMVDDRRTVSVSKLNGKQMSTQKWEIAADASVITIETSSGDPAKSVVDYWDKK